MAIGDHVKSLAGTDREYLVVGLRPVSKNADDGVEIFGLDGTIESANLGKLAFDYLRKIGPNDKIDGVKVRVAQIACYDEPTVHFQVADYSGAGNRGYGAAFNVNNADLYFDLNDAMNPVPEESEDSVSDGWDDDDNFDESSYEPIDAWDAE